MITTVRERRWGWSFIPEGVSSGSAGQNCQGDGFLAPRLLAAKGSKVKTDCLGSVSSCHRKC